MTDAERDQFTKARADRRDKIVADEIRAGHCPFGHLQPGQTIMHCPLGFPGCGCGDELMLNPYLADLLPDPPTDPPTADDNDEPWPW